MAHKLLHSNPILRLTEMTDHTPHVSDDTTPFHNTCVSEHNGENKIKIKDYGDEQPYNATRDRNSIPILHSSLNSIYLRLRYLCRSRNEAFGAVFAHRQALPNLSTTAWCLDQAGGEAKGGEDVTNVSAGPDVLVIPAHDSNSDRNRDKRLEYLLNRESDRSVDEYPGSSRE